MATYTVGSGSGSGANYQPPTKVTFKSNSNSSGSSGSSSSNVVVATPENTPILQTSSGIPSPYIKKDEQGRTINVDQLQQGSSVVKRGNYAYNYSTGGVQQFIPSEQGTAYNEGVKGRWEKSDTLRVAPQQREQGYQNYIYKQREQQMAQSSAIGLGLERGNKSTYFPPPTQPNPIDEQKKFLEQNQYGFSRVNPQTGQGEMVGYNYKPDEKLMSQVGTEKKDIYSYYDAEKRMGGTAEQTTYYGGFTNLKGESVFTEGTQTKQLTKELSVNPIDRAAIIGKDVLNTGIGIIPGNRIIKQATTDVIGKDIFINADREAGTGFEQGTRYAVQGATLFAASFGVGKLFQMGSVISQAKLGKTATQTISNALLTGTAYSAAKAIKNTEGRERYEVIGAVAIGAAGAYAGATTGKPMLQDTFSSKVKNKFVPEIGQEIKNAKINIELNRDIFGRGKAPSFLPEETQTAKISGIKQIGGKPIEVTIDTFAGGKVVESFLYDKIPYAIVNQPGKPITIMKGKSFSFEEFPTSNIPMSNTKLLYKFSSPTKVKTTQPLQNAMVIEKSKTINADLLSEDGWLRATGEIKLYSKTSAASPNLKEARQFTFLEREGNIFFNKNKNKLGVADMTPVKIAGVEFREMQTPTKLNYGKSTTGAYYKSSDVKIQGLDVGQYVSIQDYKQFGGVLKTTQTRTIAEFTGEISKPKTSLMGEILTRNPVLSMGKKGSLMFEKEVGSELTAVEVGAGKLKTPTSLGRIGKGSGFVTPKAAIIPLSKNQAISSSVGYTQMTQTGQTNIFNLQQSPISTSQSASFTFPTTTQKITATQQTTNAMTQETAKMNQQFNYTSILTPIVTGGLPFFFNAGFPKEESKSEIRRRRIKRKYTPSVLGLLSGLKQKKSTKGLYTGFEMRLPV